MNGFLKLLITLAVAYGAIVALAYLAQRRLLYFPDTGVIDPATTRAADMAAVTLVADDGIRIVAWYRAAPPGRPTIVLFHGNAGNLAHRDYKARIFIDQGFGVLLAGYRGYGGSGGSPTEAGLIADGRAALAFLAAEGVEDERVVLYGESLGSGIAVRLAAEREVAAVILEAPYTSIADVAANAYPFLPTRFLVLDRFDSIKIIGQVRAPILAIHGQQDTVIPPGFGTRLLAAAQAPNESAIIPGADHNDVFDAGGGRVVVDFLHRLFGPAPAP